MKMKPDDIYEVLDRAYFSQDMHESKEIAQLPIILGKAKVFLDIGASLGQYTYFANKTMRNATIIAVEADPIRFKRLKENCQKWEQESGNTVTAIHAAVSESCGEMSFYTTNSNVSGSVFARDISQCSDTVEYEWEEISVPTVRVDDLLKDYAKGVVKVDVEGAEYRVLLGARETMAKRGFKFLVEIHPWGDPSLGKTPEDTFMLMQENKFVCRKLFHHHLFQRCLLPRTQFIRILKSNTPPPIKNMIKKLL